MPRTNTLPRYSIPVVVNEPQREALMQLADSLHVLVTPHTENDVIRIALRDLWAKHNPPAVANPFLEE
jgi:hypothetical protein